MANLPTGTVTFAFTDIEGSTRLLQALGDEYTTALERHATIVRAALAEGDGIEVGTEGDAFFAVFGSAIDAVRAAAAIQRLMGAEPWPGPPVRIRIGLHTGRGVRGGDNYVGIDVHRAARIAAAGHGGQILLSSATRELVVGSLPDDLTIVDLGRHLLKDFDQPDRLYQIVVAGLPSDFPPPRTLETPTSLPPQPTSFIGRVEELDKLRAMIEPGRLVTLVGPGGAGKTRLAIEAARAAMGAFPEGVFFVDLAGLTDGALVSQAIGLSLGVREEPGTPLTATLGRQLYGTNTLIVLDNCEHLLAACATVADSLLRSAPSVALIATTRERLGIPAEMIVEVPPLSLPTRDTVEAVASSDAGRLFVDRASALQPGFILSDATAGAIAGIARRLDGIPLALELAAARTTVLSPFEISERLDRRFGLLKTGPRTAVPRQQTLRGLIDWSHDLLSDYEQILFRRLTVFSGGFTLTAAEALDASGGAPEVDAVLDPLASLVAKSLVVADRGPTTRYRLLETIREYGRERLEASGEEDEIRSRHLAWCLALARKAEPELVGAHQREWFERLATEHDNLRAALRWGLEHASRDALETAKCLYWFWQVRGHAREGREWLEAGLARPETSEPDALRQASMLGSGSLAWSIGDYAIARERLAESAAIASTIGDPRGRAIALTILAHAMLFESDTAAARNVLHESIAIARDLGDPFVLARSLGTLADVARHDRDDGETVRLATEALAIFEQLGMDEGIAFNLMYQAEGLRRTQPERARAQLRAAIERFARIDFAGGLFAALVTLADLSAPPAEAVARLMGGLEQLRRRSGFEGTPADRAAYERLRRSTLDTLGEQRVETLVSEGRELPLDAIVELASGAPIQMRDWV